MARRKKKVFVVNVFTILKFGGPEEGGWWYEHSEVCSIYPCSRKSMGHAVNLLQKECDEHNGPKPPPLSSVLSRGRMDTCVFTEYPDMRPTPRPRYE